MGKDEVKPSFVYRQHIGHELSRHSQRCPVPVAFFQLPLMNQRQLRVPVRGELRRLDEHRLEMFMKSSKLEYPVL